MKKQLSVLALMALAVLVLCGLASITTAQAPASPDLPSYTPSYTPPSYTPSKPSQSDTDWLKKMAEDLKVSAATTRTSVPSSPSPSSSNTSSGSEGEFFALVAVFVVVVAVVGVIRFLRWLFISHTVVKVGPTTRITPFEVTKESNAERLAKGRRPI